MVTSSLDKTVKLWDVRKLQEGKPIVVQTHKKPVNSAYFSPSHGNRILTTDQHSEINVFSGPFWDLETAIAHPHRKFQYLTPIKVI
jgi:DNA damage-binding protein 2